MTVQLSLIAEYVRKSGKLIGTLYFACSQNDGAVRSVMKALYVSNLVTRRTRLKGSSIELSRVLSDVEWCRCIDKVIEVVVRCSAAATASTCDD